MIVDLTVSALRLSEKVLASKKYRNIDPDYILRLTQHELSRNPNEKTAFKNVKNKLHQTASLYYKQQINYPAFLEIFYQAKSSGGEDAIKKACKDALSLHASTAERLSFLDEYYSRIFEHIPTVQSVLDIACGLNPLCIPWMKLGMDANYKAWDIFTDLNTFLNSFFHIMDFNGIAEVTDIFNVPDLPRVDLAFLLKSIPCLNQVDQRSTSRVSFEDKCKDTLLYLFPLGVSEATRVEWKNITQNCF